MGETETAMSESHTDWLSPACGPVRAGKNLQSRYAPLMDFKPETRWCASQHFNHLSTPARQNPVLLLLFRISLIGFRGRVRKVNDKRENH